MTGCLGLKTILRRPGRDWAGLSISQLVDELIRQTDGGSLNPETVRSIVSEELQKWSSASGGKAKGRRGAAGGRST